jgi:hypothetical protein
VGEKQASQKACLFFLLSKSKEAVLSFQRHNTRCKALPGAILNVIKVLVNGISFNLIEVERSSVVFSKT